MRGLGLSELLVLQELQKGNTELKQLVADLSLDQHLRREMWSRPRLDVD